MKIAIYSRKSKFTGKGDSIGNQIDRCKDYINFVYMDNNDIEVIVFEDEGFSGKDTDRPGFRKMLHMVKTNELDGVVVYQLNRLGRKVKDILETIEIFKVFGCALHSVTEKIDTSSPMGTMFITILASISQFERDDLIQRVTDNMYLLAKDGRWLGGQVPFGFNHLKESFLDPQGRTRYSSSLVAKSDETDLIIKMYNLYLEFQSLSQLHKYLLRNNVKGKKGGYINKGSLISILGNPNYVICDNDVVEYLEESGYIVTKHENGKGFLTYCKRPNDNTRHNPKIAATSKHDGIIPSKIWLEVQYSLARNKKNKPNLGNSNKGLLAGILKCMCGASMNVVQAKANKDGIRPYYYSCSMKINSSGTICDRKNINGTLVDKRIIEEVVGYDASRVIEELNKLLKADDIKTNNLKLEEEYEKIRLLKNKKSNMFNQLSNLDPELDKEIILEYQQIIKEINLEINELNEILSDIKQSNSMVINSDVNIEEIKNKISSFKDTFHMLTHEEKKKVLRKIFEEILWDYESNTLFITYISKNLNILEEV